MSFFNKQKNCIRWNIRHVLYFCKEMIRSGVVDLSPMTALPGRVLYHWESNNFEIQQKSLARRVTSPRDN